MLTHKSLKDFWSDTQLTLSVEHFNKCIIVTGTSIFHITPNVYVQAVQTSDTASEVALERNTTAVVELSLMSQISDVLLGDSVALAIWKSFET